MISYGRWGEYSGQTVFFTHRNPKNGDVWSDDLYTIVTTRRGKTKLYGHWVPTDKVKWTKGGK